MAPAALVGRDWHRDWHRLALHRLASVALVGRTRTRGRAHAQPLARPPARTAAAAGKLRQGERERTVSLDKLHK